MANADTDRNDLQREIGALTALAFIGANIAGILFVVVQLMGFDNG